MFQRAINILCVLCITFTLIGDVEGAPVKKKTSRAAVSKSMSSKSPKRAQPAINARPKVSRNTLASAKPFAKAAGNKPPSFLSAKKSNFLLTPQTAPSKKLYRPKPGIAVPSGQKVNTVAQQALNNSTLTAYIAPTSAATHIENRHWHNANTPGTSHFDKHITMQKLNALATVTINTGIQRPGYNGRLIHEYRFTKPIGTATNGLLAHTLRVVTEPSLSSSQRLHVVTAFPTN